MREGARLILGDCLEVMKTLPDKSVDAVITDPPYGIGKAEWDNAFPTEWYGEASRVSPFTGIITDDFALKHSIPMVGEDYVGMVAARNINGMTFTKIGFSNWIACVLAGKISRRIQNSFEFIVFGDKPDHPSPKPIIYMTKLISLLTKPGDTVLDPFMGSGTTGVACVQTGRDFIGIEIDPGYFKIAERRIREAQAQGSLALGDTP
jgi:DNA modification methylase